MGKSLGVDIGHNEDLVQKLASFDVPIAVNFIQAAGAALSKVCLAAQNKTIDDLVGANIGITYQNWPRTWQKTADWFRLRAEGGMTREVISHFYFLITYFGPLSVKWSYPTYPQNRSLC